MKEIKSRLTVELSIDDVNYINELIRRDTAAPIGKFELTDGEVFDTCPNCSRVIVGYTFCPECGQRLDKSNYAI